jgi:HEAT repeat protein
MTLESVLDELADPSKRLSASQLTNLSDLNADSFQRFADVWPSIDAHRRLRIVAELADLAEDTIELNFDRVFKLALDDDDPVLRATAIRGLYEYEGADLIAPLAGLLRTDSEPEVRREAAIALGRYALAAELGYLEGPEVSILREALTESAEDTEEDDAVRARAIEALGAMSDEETENLIESIYKEESIWLKIGAVDAMGRSASDAWLPVVMSEMGSRSPEMRHAAAFAAGEIGEEEAIQPLRRLAIEDEDREVRLAAVHSLGEIGGPKARVALQSILYEGDDSLREPVEEALSEIAFNESPLNPL